MIKYNIVMKSIHTFYISILISLISLISASCNNKEFKETPPINISEVEDLVFPLDDSTVANMEYIQYFQRNDSNIFAFTNQYDNSILFYDYDSRKYLKRIVSGRGAAACVGASAGNGLCWKR